MDLTKLERRRAVQKTVVSRHLKKIDEFADDTAQFQTIIDTLQDKFKVLTEINESIVQKLEDEEDDYEAEVVESEEYMLDLKLSIQALETRHRKLAADVIPPPLLNPREPPQDEHPRNTSNSANTTNRPEGTSGNIDRTKLPVDK